MRRKGANSVPGAPEKSGTASFSNYFAPTALARRPFFAKVSLATAGRSRVWVRLSAGRSAAAKGWLTTCPSSIIEWITRGALC